MYNFPELATGAYRQASKTSLTATTKNISKLGARTGYPIVDAAMRQMNEIGWMHNRCRMIVANFLTLLINPQLGEKYFYQRLIDGDLSANNGGWQWRLPAAWTPNQCEFSTQPQAQKFDPEGEYIREWLPELRLSIQNSCSGNIPEQERDTLGYPARLWITNNSSASLRCSINSKKN